MNNYIKFSMPELMGTDLYICEDTYELYAKNERLTDGFFNALIEHYKESNFQFNYTLYNDLNYENTVIFHFSKDSICIEYNNTSKEYSVTTKEFCETFFANVKKYAIYWAAPANYRAWFFLSFDELVKQAECYREAGNSIIKKLPENI